MHRQWERGWWKCPQRLVVLQVRLVLVQVRRLAALQGQ
jgi:hypothetical protein